MRVDEESPRSHWPVKNRVHVSAAAYNLRLRSVFRGVGNEALWGIDDCRRLGTLRCSLELRAMLLAVADRHRLREWQGWGSGVGGGCSEVVGRRKGGEAGRREGAQDWQKGCDCSVVKGGLLAESGEGASSCGRAVASGRGGLCGNTPSQKGAQGGRGGRVSGVRAQNGSGGGGAWCVHVDTWI
eukprot:COSAG02_NODE_6607_length_3462_cov_3.265537_3_plen_184_part_00